VELKGIINVAKIKYKNGNNIDMKPVLCGVILPIFQPIIENPFIVATKTVSPQTEVFPDAIATYTITFTNIGLGTASNVVIIDQIPEGTVYVCNSDSPQAEFSHDGGATWDGNEETIPITHLKWTINELGPDVTTEVQFQVKVQ
ncbi:MAG: hypothetical protein AB1595_00015, partial [bacterium]